MLAKQSFRGNKTVLNENIEPLLPQKANKKFLGFPLSLWIYQGQRQNYEKKKIGWLIDLDSTNRRFEYFSSINQSNAKELEQMRWKYNKKIQKLTNKIENGNWVMRTFGEKPSYFTESEAKRNAQKLKNYLVNQGFRNAKVSYKMDSLKNIRRIKILYNIEENLPFKLHKVDILTHTDPAIDSLLVRTIESTYIKSGDNFRPDNIMNEHIRIEKLMRNNGYFGFNKQYLRPTVDARGITHGSFVIDTSVKVPATDTLFRSFDVKGLEVNYPSKQNRFQQYQFGTVRFRVENTPDAPPPTKRDSAYYQGISYQFTERYFSAKSLNSRILIRPNQLFKQADIEETNIQMSSLDQFKFWSIDPDTVGGKVRTLIRVVPNDKYQFLFEPGASLVAQSLPGASVNTSLRVRNVFNGMENFEFSIRGAVDWQTGFTTNSDFFQTTEFGANASLIFPKIMLPTRWLKTLRRKNPRTIMSLGYNYIDRQSFFARAGLRATMTYSWSKNQQESFIVSPIDLSILKTDKSAIFQQQLDTLFNASGNPLKYSYLDRAFVSSISAAYVFNNNVPNQNKRAKYFRLFVESGGTTLNLLGPKTLSSFFQEYSPYKFFKFNTEYRSFWPLGVKSQLVFRFNAGAIFNYGKNRVAPYEKSFTGGGSNSMRAWPPRRLGLGSGYPKVSQGSLPVFIDFVDGKAKDVVPTSDRTVYGRYDYQFEQLGDVILESNVELRGHLFRFIGDVNYALFLDTGNVWTLRPNEAQQNATFAFNRFYKEIAVGTGVGLRYDFSFFIIRLDLGIKVYDPSRKFTLPGDSQTIDQRYLLPYFSFRRDSPNYPVFNIGIGYPF